MWLGCSVRKSRYRVQYPGWKHLSFSGQMDEYDEDEFEHSLSQIPLDVIHNNFYSNKPDYGKENLSSINNIDLVEEEKDSAINNNDFVEEEEEESEVV